MPVLQKTPQMNIAEITSNMTLSYSRRNSMILRDFPAKKSTVIVYFAIAKVQSGNIFSVESPTITLTAMTAHIIP